MKRWIVAMVAVVVATSGMILWASAPSGITATVLSRGTYQAFKVRSAPDSLTDFKAEAKDDVDVVVRRHEYAVGAYTGWHTHPGPVFITVTKGALMFYEIDDPTCSGRLVMAGHGYVDSGRGHYARNESGDVAEDVSVIVAPVNLPFRDELPQFANPACGF